MARHQFAAVVAFLVASQITDSLEFVQPCRIAEADDVALSPSEYSEAVAGRDRADRMRAELETEMSAERLTWLHSGNAGKWPVPEKFKPRAADVALAYQEVIDRFPGTKIAGYCVARLAGHYQFQGDFDQAVRVAAQKACQLAGTPQGPQAVLDTGLIYLQGRHDPAVAAKWFSRVVMPEKAAGEGYGVSDRVYISAQQQLIKCHLQLDQKRKAEERIKQLKRIYPSYARELEDSYQFQLQAASGRTVRPVPEPRGTVFTVEVYDKALSQYRARFRRESQSPAASTSAAVEQLRRVKSGADVDKAVAALVQQGDAAVIELERRLLKAPDDFGLQHRAVRVLKGVNSEQSRVLLRRMALGEVKTANFNIEGWAGRNLIACDRSEAWRLLAATTHDVLADALNAVDGKPIDKKHMPNLRASLFHENEFVRWRAIEVMAAEPSGKYGSEVLKAARKALLSIPGQPNVDQLYRSSLQTGLTVGEASYFRYLRVLTRVQVKDDALHALAEQIKGRGRDVVLLALAGRQVTPAHGELMRMIHDSKAGMFRVWAVTALGQTGSRNDLAMLRSLATSDTLVREGRLSPPHPIDSLGPTYPVRLAAQRAIRMIERRTATAP